MGHDLLQVFCKGIIVIAGCGLAGFAEPSAVICDDAATCLLKNWNLLLPGSAAQRIPVNQNHRVTGIWGLFPQPAESTTFCSIAEGFVIDFLVVSALIRLESSSVVTFGERFIEATANGKSPMCIIPSSTAIGSYADRGLRSAGLRYSVTGRRNSGVDLAYNTLK
jgi:hypothetical protein